ncbi:nuclear apoptosis-inducing factor 1-like [Onychostoma macrolepis]|uniref:nuclear apoptosis-inducing factor 1-like n=1 Tax=Onychostoma macrolepis TaxID=369639 RepID=UPI00272B1401|nr:nuclear apoptosis-inducing factor 1-like [Onychostoma macrolepis]
MDDKKRNKNFTRQEMEVLIEEISARKKVLLGRLDNSISMQSKRRAWERVAEAVSAVANSLRDVDGVKKKWADLKSAVKKKGAERSREQKMTGGGSPSIILDAFEEKVLSVIGDTAVTGIKSGVDTEEVTLTLELLPVVSPSTLDLAGEREVEEAPLEPEMNLSQILLDGNPTLCQTPKPKEMIDIQTQLLKEVAELRKVQELLQVEREAGNRETNTRNKETYWVIPAQEGPLAPVSRPAESPHMVPGQDMEVLDARSGSCSLFCKKCWSVGCEEVKSSVSSSATLLGSPLGPDGLEAGAL